MSDPIDPKQGERDPDAGIDAPVDADALAALEAEIRALRNAPVDEAGMARMRAGLAARIEASSSDAAPVVPISSHRRWRVAAGWLAAAAAAAFFLLSSGVFDDAVAPNPARSPLPGDVVQEERAPLPGDVARDERSPAPRMVVDDMEIAVIPEPEAAPVASDAGFPAATDEELAIALEYELLADYDVIAQLDLLELLDDRAPAEGAGGNAPEGRI